MSSITGQEYPVQDAPVEADGSSASWWQWAVATAVVLAVIELAAKLTTGHFWWIL